MKLFLSYARLDDEPFVWQLHKSLTASEFDVWFDRLNMPSRGLTFLNEIRDAIAGVDYVLLVIGPHAVESDYVKAEWKYAQSICTPIIPILRLGEYNLIPDELSRYDAPDFREGDRYEHQVEYLIRQLNAEPAPMGNLIAVPQLPPNFMSRREDIEQVKQLLINDIQQPTVITGNAQRVGVHGMGGLGKSVLAAALAYECDVRRAFPDGIIWLTIGQNPQIILRQRTLARLLGSPEESFQTVEDGKAVLNLLLNDKACLIILDDVWDIVDCQAFDILDSRSRMLITSRNVSIISSLGASEYQLDLLTESQSLQMLAQWAGIEYSQLPHIASDIAKQCGNLPLGLALCGAQIRSGMRWDDLLDALNEADLEFFDSAYGSIMKSLKVSLEFLDRENQSYYHFYRSMVAFPEDTDIPEQVLIHYWSYIGNIPERHSRKLIAVFHERALIRVNGQAPRRTIDLHDLQLLYLRRIVESISAVHREFLEAYTTLCLDGWHSGPDDGYFFDHLFFHLEMAGKQQDILDTALDLRYLVAHTKAQNAFATELDLKAAKRLFPQHQELAVIHQNFRNSLHLLDKAHTIQDIKVTLLSRLSFTSVPSNRLSLLEQSIKRPYIKVIHRLPDLPHPALSLTLSRHLDWVRSFCITSDGNTLISSSGDHTIRLWDLSTGSEIGILEGHQGGIWDIDLDSEENLIASVSDDNDLIIWDIKAEKERLRIKASNLYIRTCAFSPDGLHIASAGDDGTIKLWKVLSGQLEKSFEGHDDRIWQCKFSPDGNILASSSDDGFVILWDIETSKPILKLIGHDDWVRDFDFSPDGKYIISASADKTLRLWDIENGRTVRILSEHKDHVRACAFSADGKKVVSGGLDKDVLIWDIKSGDLLSRLREHVTPVRACAFTDSGNYVVSASDDGDIKVWAVDNISVDNFRGDVHQGIIQGSTISRNGKLAASAARDNTIKVWDIDSGRVLKTLVGHSKWGLDCAFTSDNKWLVSCSDDRNLKVWNLQKFEEHLTLQGHNFWVNGCAMHPTQNIVASASGDNTIKIWNINTGNLIHTLEGHNFWVLNCAFSSDGQYLVSASADQTLKLWATESWSLVNTLYGHEGYVRSCTVTNDNKMVVSASEDKTLKVWDIEEGRVLQTLTGHHGHIYGCTICSHGSETYIISAGKDNMLKIWSLDTGKCLGTLYVDGELRSCTIAQNSASLVTSGGKGMYFLELMLSAEL